MGHATRAEHGLPANDRKPNGMAETRPFLDVIVPVHNEEKSVESSLLELSQLLAQHPFSYRLIVCEDGSTDKTLLLARQLSERLPIWVVTDPKRKGHGRAVVDGMRASTAEVCAVIEGDGQTSPGSITMLLERLGDLDACVGRRDPRHDSLLRKLLSRGFRCVYRALIGVKLRDPSYACIVIRRNALRGVLTHLTNRMNQGAFWEFHAWAHALHLRVAELPVPHRVRSDGKSRVFRIWRLPSITFHNLGGLLSLRSEIRRYQQSTAALAASGQNLNHHG
jgi:glycosyltransferase involved in cell wall biosynthesis